MEPFLGLAEAHGVYLPETALTMSQWNRLGEAIRDLPYPGELRVTNPRNMIDPHTGKSLSGIQFERGVDGWGVVVSELDEYIGLVPPDSWYMAQFRDSQYGFKLPHFVKYGNGGQAFQYNWITEKTFMDPPSQSRLASVDALSLNGTWVKTRYRYNGKGFYVPSETALHLDYYSNGLSAEEARDHITEQSHLRFIFSKEGLVYHWARGRYELGERMDVAEGDTTILMGRSSDTHRMPQRVDMCAHSDASGVYIKITNSPLWSTEFQVPYSIQVPDFPKVSQTTGVETMDNWVDQHRGIL